MDHTLVRYNTRAFEELAHSQAIRILIEQYGYPEEISSLSLRLQPRHCGARYRQQKRKPSQTQPFWQGKTLHFTV